MAIAEQGTTEPPTDTDSGDLRVAFLLVNEARYRTMERVFGVPRADANLATLLAAAVLANAVHSRAHRVFGSRPGPADALLGAVAAREAVIGAAGRSTPERPVSGTLLALVVLAGLGAPAVRRSVRRARSGSRRVRLALNRRYWRPEASLTSTQKARMT